MTANGWRFALASVVGSDHTRRAETCQDFSLCRVIYCSDGAEVLVAVVADGAGSAPYGAAGAELACTLLLEEMTTLFASGGRVQDIDRPFVVMWLEHFQNAVSSRAEAAGSQSREFSCTLLAAVIADEAAAFLQVGDGAIVVADPSEPDEYGCIFWPQRGEYENMTVFATDPASAEHLDCKVSDEHHEEVALFTDGVQRLALHLASESVHNPFFRPLFAHLRPAPLGYLPDASEALASFLDSSAVNSRTDDDKTLLLATRRPETVSAGRSASTTDPLRAEEVPNPTIPATVVEKNDGSA